jgi:hypothetical protein
MKAKLTQQAADNMVVFAYEQLRNNPCMRLGQIIMNHLNVEVTENLKWGSTDFYNWTSEDDVLEVFYRECVED